MSDLLTQNTKLSSKLQTLTGKDPQVACQGFKNLGQCVAAAHVSNNLGISFDDLKLRTTGSDAKSLGSAIHELNPNVDAKAEAKKAKGQAEKDLRKPD
jgi:outer membrane murein-binding lipoprotein Lpp